MGLGYKAISIVKELSDDIRKSNNTFKILNLCCFGYQTVTLTMGELESLLGKENSKNALLRLDRYSSVLRRRSPLASISVDDFVKNILLQYSHEKRIDRNIIGELGIDDVPGFQQALDSNTFIFETVKLFEILGLNYQAIDIKAHTKTEIIQDLNRPLQESLVGKFDITLDGGTMEHCFNVPQVLKSMIQMTSLDGFVFHISPLTWPNHGFYNFNPCLFHEFYSVNGFRTTQALIGSNYDQKPLVKVSFSEEFPLPSQNTLLFYAARKESNVAEISWPIQSLYTS